MPIPPVDQHTGNQRGISNGIWPQNPTTPRSSSDPVRRYTSQFVAIRVIHVPMSEMLCPQKKRRKFRC